VAQVTKSQRNKIDRLVAEMETKRMSIECGRIARRIGVVLVGLLSLGCVDRTSFGLLPRDSDAGVSQVSGKGILIDANTPDGPSLTGTQNDFAADAASDIAKADVGTTVAVTVEAPMPDTKMADAAAADATSPLDTRITDVAPVTGTDPSTETAVVGVVAIATGNPFAVAVKDHLVYTGDWGGTSRGTLSIIDVSDPARPRIVGSYTGGAEVQGLAVRDTQAYLANDTLGLVVVDVSLPDRPSHVCDRTESAGPSYGHATATGDFGMNPKPYVMAGGFYGASLNIYDIRKPNLLGNPIIYQTRLTWARDILDITAADNIGYLLLGDGGPGMGVDVIDLSLLPSAPAQLGSVSLPVASYGSWGKIRLAGNMLYVATSMHATHLGGLRVVDVSEARSPQVVGSLDIGDIGHVAWEGVGLDVAGSRVYILGMTALHVLDVSNPRKPVEVDALSLPTQYVTSTGGNVVVAGDYAYAVVSSAGGAGGGLVVFRIAAG
jgi:hypothetical protein